MTQETPKNNNWTDSEISELKNLWYLDTPVKIIASKLGKTEGSITAKAKREKLPSRKGERKPTPLKVAPTLEQNQAKYLEKKREQPH